MELKKVQLKFSKNQKSSQNAWENFQHLVFWPASHVPIDPKFSFHKNGSNEQAKLIAQDTISFESFNDDVSEEFNYFFASIGTKGQLICKPAKVYRMLPNYHFKDLIDEQNNDSTDRLTKREQMDELKGKFGSKKSQRDLASKRKYEIHFSKNDSEDLPQIQNNILENKNNENTDDNKERSLSTILPERNPNAKNVNEVYSISDIITEQEEQSILEYEDQLFDTIKNDYIKKLASKFEDQKHRMMAIYADVLLQMIKLNVWEMRKADPLPMIVGDIKKYVFERFTSTRHISARQMRYVITEQNKDRILIYIFILILTLNQFKPIELDKLQTYFNVTMNHIRRIMELIGCYIENMKNINGTVTKVANFRLPLNVYKEPNKLKRLRRQ